MTTIIYLGNPDVTTATEFQGVSEHVLIGHRSITYGRLHFYAVSGSQRRYCVM